MAEEYDTLNVTEEDDEIPYVEFDISVSPSDPSLELLSDQVNRGDIVVPFYQRRYVWKIEQASRLIESFLMGLPVPQVFLFINQDGELEIIDGQQRIMSVKYFFEGYFGEPDSRGRRQLFKLKGLSERSEYNGKTFEQLSDRDKRRLKNSTLRAINIKQISPKDSFESVFHIFERLNTGGTTLKAQEIRNAVYRGKIVESLQALNEDVDWQNILALKKPDKNQKDVELILRLLSLYKGWENYEKPMISHLNRAMSENRSFDTPLALEFSDQFERVTEMVSENIQKPFRPKRIVNTAALEAVMIALMEDEKITPEMLKKNYPVLMSDGKFSELIAGSTADTRVLHDRIRAAKEVLSRV
jgi:hypothetical protein